MKKQLFLLAGLAYAGVANAQATGGTGGKSGGTQIPNPLSCGDFPCIADKILGSLRIIAIPIVAIFIFYAAFLFVTAGGNEDRIKQARSTLLYTVIGYGLILIAGSIAALVNNVLNGS